MNDCKCEILMIPERKGHMIWNLIDAFRAPERQPSPTDESRRRIARNTVRRVTTGNVRLQRGEFATKEELDRQYERVVAMHFDDA